MWKNAWRFWTCRAALASGAAAALAGSVPAAGQTTSKAIRVTPVVRAYRAASGAVVNISTERLVSTGAMLLGWQDDPFEPFTTKLFRKVPVISLGSGFVIHPSGYIVTNAHVVRRAEKINVVFADKSQHSADVVAENADHDLAVLKIAPPKGKTFPHLHCGRSDDLMIGETVIAIGNPMGYQNTCTTGVISALGRKLEFRGGQTYRDLIQTDAPINPGNSGGPLLNIAGELIGINTAIRADAQGIGFAIPVDALVADLPRLLDFERRNRVIVGLAVEQKRTKDAAELIVARVADKGPAARAGCKVGDRIVALNGKPVGRLSDYQIAMFGAKAGAKVRLRCRRNGKTVNLTVTVKPRPKPDAAALAKRLFGMELANLTAEQARQLRLPVKAGLLVVAVEAKGPASRLGIRRHDVIFQLGRWHVANLDDAGAILEDVAPGEAVRIGVVTGRQRAWGVIRARPIDTQPPTTGKRTTI